MEKIELTDEQKILAQTLLVRFSDKEQMALWIYNFLGIIVADEIIDENSTASMLEAGWECYEAFMNDTSKLVPGYIWLSARDCGKTLMGSILNIILMLHFDVSVAHMAAIKDQSQKSLSYINGFIRKLAPYLEYMNCKVVSESKDRASVQNEALEVNYIRVITATAAGGNSEHTPVVSFDELEVLSPEGLKGYKEAQNIPTRFNGYGPLVIKYSTRKYAAGIFAREVADAAKTGQLLRQWNLIDMTEKCKPERHQPEQPKVKLYTRSFLPLSTITPDQYNSLPEKEKDDYKEIEAYAGCAKCPLLPVCKTKLAHRSDKAVCGPGSLYKDIDQVIGNFSRNTDPEIAEPQLLCWRPSTRGLVYPRFAKKHGEDGNLLSLREAYFEFFAEHYPADKDLTHKKFVEILVKNKVNFYCGVDFGTTNAFAIVVCAKFPGNKYWVMESIAITDLEFDEMLAEAKKIKVKYNPKAWYADYAIPAFIKTFKKNGLNCPKFIKDVMGGIEAVRGVVVNAVGQRHLRVLDVPQNRIILEMFEKHSFKLDSLGEPTEEPDDIGGIADPGDALRYLGQGIFEKKQKRNYNAVMDLPKEVADPQKWVQVEIKRLTTPTEPVPKPKRLILDIDEE